ncbi:ATP-dependent acyl-CoA ligase [Paradesulfitobacterium aromaticivorans]
MQQQQKNPYFLRDLIVEQAQKWGDKTFLYFEDEQYSYRNIDQTSNRLANGLIDLGVVKGEKVGVMLPNHPDFIFSWFALAKIGCVIVPVNTALKGDGLAYILDHSDSKTVIISHQYWEQFERIKPQLTKVKRIIISTADAPSGYQLPANTMPLDNVYSSNDTLPEVTLAANDMARIMYTSGTTGIPKGVVQFQPITIMPKYTPEDVAYTCLPLFHANAMILTTQSAMAAGAAMVLSRRFSASKFWDEIRRYGATSTSLIGAMITILFKQAPQENDAYNPVRFAFSGAAPRDIWQAFEKRFGLQLLEGYAAVDGAGVLENDNGILGSIGKPVGLCEAKVVDENGNEVGPNTVGELLTRIKGATGNMVIYYKNEEETRKKNSGGWVWSGDYVYYDNDGNFFFVDRKKDALRRRGENVSSWEVERIINQHPDVLESAVFGVASELGEDDIMAIIVPQPGKKPDIMSIIKWCDERMAYFMVPRYIEFWDSLEKTSTYRVQKVELKKRGVTKDTWDAEKSKVKIPS